MLNPNASLNSRPDGFGVLEVSAGEDPKAPRRFVPLRRTELAGDVVGPLGTLRLTQTFAIDGTATDPPIEALYRFPLPGDAAVTGVRVRFGEVEIQTTLKERREAEKEYQEGKRSGRQAALLTRESPDVFTLAVAGIRPGQDVQVETSYVQVARAEAVGWSLRIPLTTAPRYVREDELGSRHASGQPLALLRDPGHRVALDLKFAGAEQIASSTHALAIDGGRVRLKEGEVVPDRDCVMTWRPTGEADRPALRAWVQRDPASGRDCFLALCTPPRTKASTPGVAREVVLLVDHSGSMSGPKWEAADWAVEKFLAGLGDRDSFALGLFHTSTKWLAEETQAASPEAVRQAVAFLKKHRDTGGTELGVALEQALALPRASGSSCRHVLIITDAEVSDAGRILRLADAERTKPERRRVSVLCIDAAPNAALASELAERGGGVSRFLTSDPKEDDITTALDETLADWSAPLFAGLTLEADRPAAEAAGRLTMTLMPDASTGIDLGDLPADRPVWVAGRVPAGDDALTFRLRSSSGELLAASRAEAAGAAGLKALFGAQRIRRLEWLMNSGLGGEELKAELAQLGYAAAASVGAKVYAENARAAARDVVRKLLIEEALAAGLPSAETAFVAVRSEAGQMVGETAIVANAWPAGWKRLSGGIRCVSASLAAMAPADSGGDMMRGKMAFGGMIASAAPLQRADGPKKFDRAIGGPAAAYFRECAEAPPVAIRVRIAAGHHPTAHGAVLFDSAREASTEPIPDAGRLTALSLVLGDPAVTADPGLTLLLFVGDLATPRAKVRLADLLRQGGRRPLNVRRAPAEAVRLTLEDPNGAWAAGVPALEIVLNWD